MNTAPSPCSGIRACVIPPFSGFLSIGLKYKYRTYLWDVQIPPDQTANPLLHAGDGDFVFIFFLTSNELASMPAQLFI